MDDNEEVKKDVEEKVEKKEEKVISLGDAIAGILRVPLFFGFSCINNIVEGFILSKMWLWFIMSKFPHVPVISWIDAFGISWMINFILNDIRTASMMNADALLPKDTDVLSVYISKNLTKIFINHPLTLLVAWSWWKLVILRHP